MFNKSLLPIFLAFTTNSLAAQVLANSTIDSHHPLAADQVATKKEVNANQPHYLIENAPINSNRIGPEDFSLLVKQGRSNRIAEKYQASIRYYRQALIACKNSTMSETDIAAVYHELSVSYFALGQLSNTQKILEEGVQQLSSDRSSNLDLRPAKGYLAYFYDHTGQFAAAESIYREWLKNTENTHKSNSKVLLSPLHWLSCNLVAQGKYEDAEKLCLRAIEISSTTDRKDTLGNIDTLDDCGNLYTDSSQFDKAEVIYQKSLSVAASKFPEAQSAERRLSDFLKQTSESPENSTKPIFHEFDRCPELSLHPETSILNNLAILYQKQRKFKTANFCYELALDLIHKLNQTSTEIKEEAVIWSNLASLKEDQCDIEAAETLYLKSIAVKQNFWGPFSPYLINSQINYMNLLKSTNRFSQANSIRMLVRKNDTYKYLTKDI